MSVHSVTALLQRSQSILKVIGLVPFQLPVVASSVWPTVGVPVITGGEVACGAPAVPWICWVAFEVAWDFPSAFFALTRNLSVKPTSALATMYWVPVSPAIALHF